MQIFPRLAVLALLVAIAVRAPASERAIDQARVVEIIEQMYVALTKDDLDQFKKLTTPDYLAFDGGERFTADSLARVIRDIHAAGKVYVWNVVDPVVEVDGNIALITYTNNGSVTDAAGAKKEVTWLESAVLRKDKGEWRIRFFHSTRVPVPMRG